VESLPSVIAIKDRKAVGTFSGLVSEKDLDQFLLQVGGSGGPIASEAKKSPSELLTAGRQALDAKDIRQAAMAYATILENPESKDSHFKAHCGLVHCAISEGNLETAESLLKTVLEDPNNKHQLKSSEVLAAQNAIDLARQLKKATSETEGKSIPELQALLKANPDDLAARYTLATLYFAKAQHEAAIQEILQVLKKNRNYNENGRNARKLVMSMFDSLGANHPVVRSMRKQLTNILI